MLKKWVEMLTRIEILYIPLSYLHQSIAENHMKNSLLSHIAPMTTPPTGVYVQSTYPPFLTTGVASTRCGYCKLRIVYLLFYNTVLFVLKFFSS